MLNTFTRSLILTALALGNLSIQAQEAKVFKAGAATANITPWLGTSLAGSMADRLATRVDDELHVRAIVMDDGATQLAIALVDCCMILRPIIDAGKDRASAATGIPQAHMLVAATHSHSAGTCANVFQSAPDPEYTALVTRRIGDAITQAYLDRVPAKIAWGAGSVPDEVHNRRWYMKKGGIGEDPFGKTNDKVRMNPPRASEFLDRPAGPTDPEVSILALQTTEGKPLALLANYSLHYVGGMPGVSADYFGVFNKAIADLLGAEDDFVAIMSNGTSGDINNIDFTKPQPDQKPGEQMFLVGNKVAKEVHRAYGELQFQDWVPLAAAQREITLGVRKPTPEEVDEARTLLKAAEGRELQGLREIYANCTVDLASYPDTEDLVLQAFQIGDLAIGAIPCEVFVEIGLAIKEQTPFDDAFTIELANGYNGYLPTEAQHPLGGYETWRAKSSHLEVKAATVIQQVVLELMAELKQ
jgi:neutral ceramidase